MFRFFILFIVFSLGIQAFEGKIFQKLNNFKDPKEVFFKILTDNGDIKFKLKKATFYQNKKYLHYVYSYKNIPVDNQTIVIALENNKPYFIFGNFKIPSLNLKPNLTPFEAFGKFKSSVKKIKFHSDIKKVYLIKDKKSYLAYKSFIEYVDKKGYHLGEIYLNAENSEVLLFKSHVYEALNREIYTFDNACLADQDSYEALPGNLVIAEGQSDVSDNVVQDAYDNTGITYWFYKRMFNRDSFDNNGIKLVSTVHASFDFDDGWGCIGGNAFFMGYPYDQMVYGDGDDTMYYLSQALDVTAHELTHAVTDRTSGLYYNGESGALNEAMSDIFGATTEAWADSGGNANANPSNFTANEDNWKIGEDIMRNGVAMRYMNNPHLAEDPDEYNPDHYSQRYIGDYDEGGVHINSTIISLAYYLLVTGGNHPRSEFQNIYPDVNGIGLEKAIKIFYHAQTNYFTSDTNFDFRDARRLLSLSAEDLYGNCSNESEQVNRAFDIVGVPGDRREECGGSGGDNPCQNMNCPVNSHCDLNENNQAGCYCDQGYHVEDTDGDGQYDSCVIDDGDVCSGVDCNREYPNSVCIEYQGGPACACPDGWGWNDEQTECVNLGLDICEDVTCSYHGVCVNDEGEAKCNCDEGYQAQGLECVEINVDPCKGINCSGHGVCTDNEGVATCNCDEGYQAQELECVKIDLGPCKGITCSGHGVCTNNEGVATCNCDEGYQAQELECIKINTNPCDGINCSNHGVCKIENNEAYCDCDEGFVKGENYTCVESNEDLCKDVSCSGHGTCVIHEDKAACLCDNGYKVENLECVEADTQNNNDNKSQSASSCSFSASEDYSFLIFVLFILLFLANSKKKSLK